MKSLSGSARACKAFMGLAVLSVPKTNVLPLKNSGCEATFLLGKSIFRCYVSSGEGIHFNHFEINERNSKPKEKNKYWAKKRWEYKELKQGNNGFILDTCLPLALCTIDPPRLQTSLCLCCRYLSVVSDMSTSCLGNRLKKIQWANSPWRFNNVMSPVSRLVSVTPFMFDILGSIGLVKVS